MTQILNFLAHLGNYIAENITERRPFKTKNNTQSLPKQTLNNFEKVQKTTFLTLTIVKNDPSKRSKWAKY